MELSVFMITFLSLWAKPQLVFCIKKWARFRFFIIICFPRLTVKVINSSCNLHVLRSLSSCVYTETSPTYTKGKRPQVMFLHKGDSIGPLRVYVSLNSMGKVKILEYLLLPGLIGFICCYHNNLISADSCMDNIWRSEFKPRHRVSSSN